MPLRNPEGEADQVAVQLPALGTVSCCSSQRMRCRERGSRTRYWHSAWGGLVEDAGPTLDREAGVLPSENLAGEVGVQQTLLEEQGDDTATPDLGEGRGGSQRDGEECIMAIEAAFEHDGVPVGVPHAELAECLVAGDHGAAQ